MMKKIWNLFACAGDTMIIGTGVLIIVCGTELIKYGINEVFTDLK